MNLSLIVSWKNRRAKGERFAAPCVARYIKKKILQGVYRYSIDRSVASVPVLLLLIVVSCVAPDSRPFSSVAGNVQVIRKMSRLLEKKGAFTHGEELRTHSACFWRYPDRQSTVCDGSLEFYSLYGKLFLNSCLFARPLLSPAPLPSVCVRARMRVLPLAWSQQLTGRFWGGGRVTHDAVKRAAC